MAKQLETVLVAVGPKDRGSVTQFLDIVEAIAGPAEATVVLLHVFEQDEYDDLLEQLDVDRGSDSLDPDTLAVRHKNIQSQADRFEDIGIDYEVRGVIGEPEKEVVHEAERLGVDLLFVGGQRRSPAGKAVFGASSQQILLNAPCPVTYIKRDE